MSERSILDKIRSSHFGNLDLRGGAWLYYYSCPFTEMVESYESDIEKLKGRAKTTLQSTSHSFYFLTDKEIEEHSKFLEESARVICSSIEEIESRYKSLIVKTKSEWIKLGRDIDSLFKKTGSLQEMHNKKVGGE